MEIAFDNGLRFPHKSSYALPGRFGYARNELAAKRVELAIRTAG